MSKYLRKILGSYNQQLTAVLASAEQHWPTLCADEDETLTDHEVAQRRRTLLLAMTYLDQMQQLLSGLAAPPAAPAFREQSRPARARSAPEER